MGRTIVVNGVSMDVPDNATRETLLDKLRIPQDSVVYAITPSGEHRVLNEGDPMSSLPSERLGTVPRFRAAGDEGAMISIGSRLAEQSHESDPPSDKGQEDGKNQTGRPDHRLR